jgi:hypothetical protein
MPFWRRGATPRDEPEAPQPTAPPPISGTHACSERGCSSTEGERCGYVDRRGRSCGTAWCPDHQSIVGGVVYCRRHAGVVKALSGDARGAAALPDLENRAPSLATWVSRDVEEAVAGIVRSHAAELGGDRLISDPVHLVFLGPERLRAWERSWRLVAHTGWTLRVALEVEESRDTEVVVRVGRNVVARLEPPWIAARRGGESPTAGDDAVRRQQFYRALVELVASAVDAELRDRPG